MKPYQSIPAVLLGLGLSLFTASKAEAFSFTKIADDSGTYSYTNISPGLATPWYWAGSDLNAWDESVFNWTKVPWSQGGLPALKGIALNNNGQSAFVANLKTGGSGIILSDGIVTTTIARTNSKILSFAPGISVNNKGTVAFTANLATGGQAIFTADGNGGLTKIAEVDSRFSSFAPGVSINDDGTVAFLANLVGGGTEIFIGKNQPSITQITDCANSYGPECNLKPQRPSINNSGDVAFVSEQGVYVSNASDRKIVKVMSDSNNFIPDAYYDPNINDLGRVLYGTLLQNRYSGTIETSKPGEGNVLWAGNTPPLHSIARAASINEGGNVIFMGEATTYGIFTGMPDYLDPKYGGDQSKVVSDMWNKYKVIAQGDVLDGSKVKKLSIDRESLNKIGQILFWAELENGRQGLYRASPDAGESQFNPLMPNWTTGENGSLYSFTNQKGRVWFDPIPASGFTFNMNSDSLFTEVVNFPLGFTDPFIVSVGNLVLGQFNPGENLQFSKYAQVLGNLLVGGMGVKNFTVSGLSTDASNPATAFPIQLDFNTDLASFDMIAQTNPAQAPEPGETLGYLVAAIFGVIAVRKYRRKSLSTQALLKSKSEI